MLPAGLEVELFRPRNPLYRLPHRKHVLALDKLQRTVACPCRELQTDIITTYQEVHVMKTTTSYSFHALFLALSFLLVAPALGQQPDRVGTREVKTAQWRGKHIQYAEGKVSVKLKEGANKGVARNAVQAVVGRTLQDFDELGWGFFEVPEDQSVLDVVSELEKLPSVSIAHPVSVGTIGTTPDDDFLSNQWGLINTSQNAGTADSDIDADLAWDHTTGSSDVVIAVLDLTTRQK